MKHDDSLAHPHRSEHKAKLILARHQAQRPVASDALKHVEPAHSTDASASDAEAVLVHGDTISRPSFKALLRLANIREEIDILDSDFWGDGTESATKKGLHIGGFTDWVEPDPSLDGIPPHELTAEEFARHPDTLWHGSPWGEMGPGPIHAGTQLAAYQALRARMLGHGDYQGNPGKYWDLDEQIPEEGFKNPWSDKFTHPPARNPRLIPVQLAPHAPVYPHTTGDVPEYDNEDSDTGFLWQEPLHRGYVVPYINSGEDAGSVSYVAPSKEHFWTHDDFLRNRKTADVIQGPWARQDEDSPYRTCPKCKEPELMYVPRYENVQGEWMGDLWHCNNCGHGEHTGLKLASSDEWKPGLYGKGFALPDGTIHHWRVQEQDGWPDHVDEQDRMNIPYSIPYDFTIEPDGKIGFYGRYDARAGKYDQNPEILQQILDSHPRFYHGSTRTEYASVTSSVPIQYHSDIDPETLSGSLKGYTGRWPTIWDQRTLHIGPEGSVHLDLRDKLDLPWSQHAKNLRALPEGYSEGWIGHNPEGQFDEAQEHHGVPVGWYRWNSDVPDPSVSDRAAWYLHHFISPVQDPNAEGGFGHAYRLAALAEPLEPHLDLYHGTTNKALELAQQRGGLHAWHPRDVAQQVAEHYALDPDELYNHPYFEFSRSGRDDNKIYMTTDPTTAEHYANTRSEQLTDALHTAHRMLYPQMYSDASVEGFAGEPQREHRDALNASRQQFEQNYHAQNDLHPQVVKLRVPYSALDQRDQIEKAQQWGYEPSGTYTTNGPVPLDWMTPHTAKVAAYDEDQIEYDPRAELHKGTMLPNGRMLLWPTRWTGHDFEPSHEAMCPAIGKDFVVDGNTVYHSPRDDLNPDENEHTQYVSSPLSPEERQRIYQATGARRFESRTAALDKSPFTYPDNMQMHVEQPTGWDHPYRGWQEETFDRAVMPHYRTPFWIGQHGEDPNNHRIFLGHPGSYHDVTAIPKDYRIIASGAVKPAGYGEIGPGGGQEYPHAEMQLFNFFTPRPKGVPEFDEYTDYEGEDDPEVTRALAVENDYQRQVYDKAHEALRNEFPELGWKTSKTAAEPWDDMPIDPRTWQRGVQYEPERYPIHKGTVDEQGDVHVWPVNVAGFPHHSEIGIKPYGEDDLADFIIDGDRLYSIEHPTPYPERYRARVFNAIRPKIQFAKTAGMFKPAFTVNDLRDQQYMGDYWRSQGFRTRHPLLYDHDTDTLHIGPVNATHPQVMKHEDFDSNADLSYGWIGPNYEKSINDAVYNRNKPNEVGWYVAPELRRPPAAVHQFATQLANENLQQFSGKYHNHSVTASEYDHEDSLIGTATSLVDMGTPIEEAASWLTQSLTQSGRPEPESQAISDEVFQKRGSVTSWWKWVNPDRKPSPVELMHAPDDETHPLAGGPDWTWVDEREASRENTMNWEPGNWGKGVIIGDEPHTWNTAMGGVDFMGSPHHAGYLKQHGIDVWNYNDWQRFSDPIVIGPEGWYTLNDTTPGSQLTKTPERFAQIGGGLKYVDDEDKWRRRVGKNSEKWQLAATDVRRDEYGHPTVEPWREGTWGKGMLVDGEPHVWQTENPGGSPHHLQYARLQGLSDTDFDLATDLIQIAPDGSYAVDPDGPNISQPERFAQMVPGLRYMRDVNRWNMRAFSKTAEIWPGKKPPWDNSGSWGSRQPFRYFPDADVMLLGNPGTHHMDLNDDYPMLAGAIKRPLQFRNMDEGEVHILPDEPPTVDYFGDYSSPEAQRAFQHIQSVHPEAQWNPFIQSQMEWQRMKTSRVIECPECHGAGQTGDRYVTGLKFCTACKGRGEIHVGDTSDLYHVAPTTERVRIQQHGLQPSNPVFTWGTSPKEWEDFHGEGFRPPVGIYGWPEAFEGRPKENQYLDMLNKERGMPHDIWRIPNVAWQPDPDLTGAGYVTHPVMNAELHYGPDMDEWAWPEEQREKQMKYRERYGSYGKLAGLDQYAEMVPIDAIDHLREYDRTPGGAPGVSADPKYWENLKNHIAQNGFENPVVLDYNPWQGTGYVSEGNHRIGVAKELGMTHVPMFVYRTTSEHPRMKPMHEPETYVMNDKYGFSQFPQYAKPSEIGLPVAGPYQPAEGQTWYDMQRRSRTDHAVWWQPGDWGRGFIQRSNGRVHSWPEGDASHQQAAWSKNIPWEDVRTTSFLIRPDGMSMFPYLPKEQAHIEPDLHAAIQEADPRLKGSTDTMVFPRPSAVEFRAAPAP